VAILAIVGIVVVVLAAFLIAAKARMDRRAARMARDHDRRERHYENMAQGDWSEFMNPPRTPRKDDADP